MQAQTNTDFSQGSVSSNIVRLAVPMTLAQLVNVLYNIIDRIYIGRIGADATNALTGLGVCFPIITMILAFSNLVGMGGAPLFSMRRGAGEPEEAEAILGNCFSLLLGIGVSLTVFGLLIRCCWRSARAKPHCPMPCPTSRFICLAQFLSCCRWD